MKTRNIDFEKVCLIYREPHSKGAIQEVVQTKNRFTKLYKQFNNKSLKLLAVLDKEMMVNLLNKF